PDGVFARGQTQRPPNILFMLADDHAAHALSCYGSRINQTPQIDRIARGGLRFTNCFCTNAICAPSRATILTGAYSHRNGVVDNTVAFDASQPTWPKLLQAAGYQTALVGKWHLKSTPTGFEHWSILPGQGAYHDPVFDEQGTRTKHAGYVTDVITDMCLKWLAGRDPKRPFLLMCQHKAPHRPWEPDEKHARLYEDTALPEPETFDDDYATRCAAARRQEMTIEHHLTSTDTKGPPPPELEGPALKRWKYQRYIKDYLRCVASVDDNVGRLLDYLDAQGLTERTVVVYTSDQGFFLGDHGWYDKRFMYEESLRMPLLLRFPPEIRPGTVNASLVLDLDYAPTFLDYAGVPPAARMQGASWRLLASGRTQAPWRTSAYFHYYEYPDPHRVAPHYGVRTQRYKLIHFYDPRATEGWELYDLEKDPHELRNVYADPAYADQVPELKAELQRLRQQYGDTGGPATRAAPGEERR
ncbi:MAG: sulfatase, partial [Planctomycetota bacterium]